MKLIIKGGGFLFIPQNKRDRKVLKHHKAKKELNGYRVKNKNLWCKYYEQASPNAKEILKRFTIVERTPPPWKFPEGKTPKEFQPRVINWILSRNRSYANVGPGGGKCAIAFTCVNADPGKTLIIAPSTLTLVWFEEQYPQWANPNFKILLVKNGTTLNEINQADIVVIADTQLKKYSDRLKFFKWKWLFIDEAQRYNRRTSQKGTALYGSARQTVNLNPLIWHSENSVWLSGTVMKNRPMELYPVLLMGAPETIGFMSKDQYGMRYCGGKKNHFGYTFDGVSNLDELHRRVTEKFMIVVTEREVKKHLPPLIEHDVFMGEKVPPKTIRTLEEIIKSKYPIGSDLLIAAKNEDPELATFRKLVGICKVGLVVPYIEDLLRKKPKAKFIVFAIHKTVIKGLCYRLAKYNPIRIDGSVGNTKKKQELINAFRTKKKHRLIVANIFTMGLGYTITEATEVLGVEQSYCPTDNDQARDRAHRTGQTKSVTLRNFILRNTLDERVYKLNKQKRVAINVLNTGEKTMAKKNKSPKLEDIESSDLLEELSRRLEAAEGDNDDSDDSDDDDEDEDDNKGKKNKKNKKSKDDDEDDEDSDDDEDDEDSDDDSDSDDDDEEITESDVLQAVEEFVSKHPDSNKALGKLLKEIKVKKVTDIPEKKYEKFMGMMQAEMKTVKKSGKKNKKNKKK